MFNLSSSSQDYLAGILHFLCSTMGGCQVDSWMIASGLQFADTFVFILAFEKVLP